MNKKFLFGILLGVVLIYFSLRGINFNDTLTSLKKIHPEIGRAHV